MISLRERTAWQWAQRMNECQSVSLTEGLPPGFGAVFTAPVLLFGVGGGDFVLRDDGLDERDDLVAVPALRLNFGQPE